MSHVKAENDHDSGLASNRTTYVIGTRESQLAMVQTTHVKTLLETLHPTLTFEVKGMSTTGDNIQDVALSKIGSKSLFTKELEVALHQKTVDLVVHSLKDLPTQLPPGMFLGAILERELPNDVVIMGLTHTFKKLADLPAGSVIGTSSVRRSAQLRRRYPSLMFQDIRGNLNTRLRKLDDASSPFAALLLAYAGVHRLGWTDRISEILPTSTLLYAVGQGAIAVECREFDHEVKDLLKPLSSPCYSDYLHC
ncbi:porphobilinogen deaminase [Batrachochytrium salamandrivorans]|nr:porphobilinogen deaminase [Batrachochytrium salamandrivorans]